MHISKSLILISFFCLTVFLAQGQVTSVSPFSRYGLGDLQPNFFAPALGAGGITQAYRHQNLINVGNPASLTALKFTTLEVGLLSNTYQQESASGINQFNNITNFGYIAVGIPVADWWAFNVNLRPYSQTGYINIFQETHPDFGLLEYRFSGNGSLAQVQWGNGFKIGKHFSLGVNSAFIWGNNAYLNDVVFLSNNFFNTRREETYLIRGLQFDFGMQYEQPIDKKGTSIVLGATYDNGSTLNNDISLLDYTFRTNQGIAAGRDTVGRREELGTPLQLPSKGGAGLTIQRRDPEEGLLAWLISAEYTYQNWSEFSIVNSPQQFINSERIAIGATMVPSLTFSKLKNSRSIFNRMEYKAGFYTGNTFIEYEGGAIQDYGMTLGFTIPLTHKALAGEERYSRFTISAALGERGNLSSFGYRERYANVLIGISVNDKWFNKFKYR